MNKTTRQHGTPSDRFWAKVDKAGECWVWTAYIDKDGYGRFRGSDGRVISAHQWSYEDASGPVPDGLQVDHLCRNRACVRPSHLEAVTQVENGRRGLRGALHAPATHCGNGHSMTAENTYSSPPTATRPNGQRRCRICDRAKAKAQWIKTKNDRAHTPQPTETP